jgi:ABC-type branched-subunit amino acid transport system substrate-binding protein
MNIQGGDNGVIAHPDDDRSEEIASMGEDVHNGVANSIAYNPEEGNYSDVAAEAMSYEPTEVGVVGTPNQALDFINALVDEGYSGVWVFDEHLRTDGVAAEVGSDLETVFAVAPNPVSSPGEGNLNGRFGGETNEYSTYAYDAMALIALGMHQGGEAQGYESSLNIADIASTTPDVSNEAEIVAGVDGLSEAKTAIDDRNAINYQGASGLVNLSLDHNPLNRMGIYELGDESFSHLDDIPGEEFERSTGGPATG